MNHRLWQPLRVGALELPNRIVMAPLTRCRAVNGRVPNALMARYYEQRAGAGLILAEATAITPTAVGYANTPGIWNEEQVAGWQTVTDAVHRAGGRIALQLWHVGRISDPYYLGGERPVAPSAIAAGGLISRLHPPRPYMTPRALETAEIAGIVADYRRAASLARQAGFDGVEVHAANGYLIDQFLQASSNRRTDNYGGSVANRTRLLLEVVEALCAEWSADRVGVHLAPRGGEDPEDPSGAELFSYVAEQLGDRGIAYVCAREPWHEGWLLPMIKQAFGGVVIANQEFTRATAEAVIEQGIADAVAFGRLYIANPDLVERFARDAALNVPDPSTFYGPDERGYTDYPQLTG
jgi:2,4-dienoyl-CoA reductase-like NADH-dependent reductase (Old Yellow Enzyme family)